MKITDDPVRVYELKQMGLTVLDDKDDDEPIVIDRKEKKPITRVSNLGKKYVPAKKEKPEYYNVAIDLIEQAVPHVIQTLVDGLDDDDAAVRVKCAEILLKKVVPDKKRNEHTGADGGPVQIAPADIQQAISEVDAMIEEVNG